MYGRQVGPMKMYMEAPVKDHDTPEVFETLEEAEARIKDLTTNNPIAHGSYRAKELDDADKAKWGL